MNIDNIIKENDALIYSIINRYKFYNDKEDLYQVSVIGLINAYRNYDDEKDTKFMTYAYFYILGEVKKYIRESKLFKSNRQLEKLSLAIAKAKILLTQKLCKEPTIEELGNYLELDESVLYEALEYNAIVKSLDEEINEDSNLYNNYGYEEKAYSSQYLDLKNEIESLEEPYKSIILNRYYNELTQTETASVLGMSQVQIFRKEKEGLQRLRTRL